MQLNDIVEKYTIREISYQTKISITNLEKILAKDFESLSRLKAFGFLSILEREYKADLSEIREEANQYYMQFSGSKNSVLNVPLSDEKKGNSKFFLFVIIALLGYASWYFFTQFDKKHLSEMIPFIDESIIEKFMPDKSDDNSSSVEALSSSVVAVTKIEVNKEPEAKQAEVKQENTVQEDTVEKDTSKEDKKEEKTQTDNAVKQVVSIVPVNRLWFGLIDLESRVRDHFSIADAYTLDVSSKRWLVATSSASFSLQSKSDTKAFSNNKEHYFLIDKEEIKVLTKSEYVALGGWDQW